MQRRQHTERRQTDSRFGTFGPQSPAQSQNTADDERGIVGDDHHDPYYAWRIIPVTAPTPQVGQSLTPLASPRAEKPTPLRTTAPPSTKTDRPLESGRDSPWQW